MEAGDLAAAERYLRQAEGFMRTAPEFSDHLNLFGNLGELSAMSGRFDEALTYYGKARDALRPQDHWRLRQLTYGGLGYTALELGDLRLARECESKIEYKSEAYFDPWVIALFKATLLKRRGEHDRAIDYLEELSSRFAGRLRLVAIKLRLLACRLCQGRQIARGRRMVEELLRETEQLQLARRNEEALHLARSLGG
jgi:tetratricopeptide (TPR) repeat protein